MGVWFGSWCYQIRSKDLSDVSDHLISMQDRSLDPFCDVLKTLCFYCKRLHFLRNIHWQGSRLDSLFGGLAFLMLMEKAMGPIKPNGKLYLLILVVDSGRFGLLLHSHMNGPS